MFPGKGKAQEILGLMALKCRVCCALCWDPGVLEILPKLLRLPSASPGLGAGEGQSEILEMEQFTEIHRSLFKCIRYGLRDPKLIQLYYALVRKSIQTL